MKITNISELKEEQKSNKSFINEVVDIIFAICKEEPLFFDVSKNNNDIELTKLKTTIQKQNDLLKESETIKQNIKSKIKLLNEQIENMRISLLESLEE